MSVESCIWGGIVTFNPDIQRLGENIRQILPQVDHLLIFDNGSNNIAHIEQNFSEVASIIENIDNSGMAIALNCMARSAKQGGATDILFLDQDSVAADDLVEKEAIHRSDNIGLISCRVMDRNNLDGKCDCADAVLVKRAITSGSMLNLTVWEKIGGYDERLFVDWVDYEYCNNLRINGFQILRVNRTCILHEKGHQQFKWRIPSVNPGSPDNSGKAFCSLNYPSWRWRDLARSQSITIRKYLGTTIALEEIGFFLKRTLARVLFLEDNKLECLRAIWDGIRAGHDECRR